MELILPQESAGAPEKVNFNFEKLLNDDYFVFPVFSGLFWRALGLPELTLLPSSLAKTFRTHSLSFEAHSVPLPRSQGQAERLLGRFRSEYAAEKSVARATNVVLPTEPLARRLSGTRRSLGGGGGWGCRWPVGSVGTRSDRRKPWTVLR